MYGNDLNQYVFLTRKERVYCEVRTIFLYIVYVKFGLQNVTKLTRYVIPYLFAANSFRPETERIRHFCRTKHV